MPAIPSGHDHYNVVGTVGHRHQGIRIMLVNPGGPVPIPIMGNTLQSVQRHAGLLVDIFPYGRL
jgi:hypothetical protein